ncbi:MAG: radical SAM/SPASM domain-containing protein [Archaeoglobus sp.]|nr:MAG: radical SAM/SPASM domain-containing protein [Archaeoglobus sp.]
MFDIREKPFIVFWELTRACMLACKHCRAKAQKKRHPNELSTEEAFKLVDMLKEFGKPYPLVVVTGGDPLMREDLFEILEQISSSGIRVAVAFSGTPLATREKIEMLKDSGVARIAISIDGSNAAVHDTFRGVKGTFDTSMAIIENAKEMKIPLQINTTVTGFNLRDLPNMVKLCLDKGVTLWDVFFVVPTGRAKAEYMPSGQEFEDVLCWLYDVSRTTNLNVKSSAACHLRRIEFMRDRGVMPHTGELYQEFLEELKKVAGENTGENRIVMGSHYRSLARDGIKRMMGITDGRGMFFVSHVGEVYPSGFLPIVTGNIREKSLKEIYMESPIFQDLKDPEKLKGKCGRCEFRYICGGSRARAYAVYGDYLAQEPRCIYSPGKFNLIKI